MKRLLFAVSGTLACVASTIVHTAPAAGTPTFAKDVAPIVFDKCASCHRPGEVAPMSLLSYEDVRPWAKVIKTKVTAREMPPWGADPEHSLKMRNDKSLSRQQIDTIAAWVDAGAPRGNDADMPPVPKFSEGWTNGTEPDAVLEMPVDFDIPAEGEVGVQMFYSKIPFDTDKFAEVLELRPGNRAVLHHAGVFVVDIPEGAKIVNGRLVGADGKVADDRARSELRAEAVAGLPGSNKLLSWVPGRGLDHHRDDIGKRIPAGKYLNWQLHYNPTGKPEKDRTKLGIWFNKKPVTHELLIRQAGDPLATTKGGLSLYRAEGKEVEYVADEGSTRRRSKTPNIPPYAEDWSLTGITPVTEDITLYTMSPHMHLRGKSLKWVVVYPDGREQTILDVPKFDFNWQLDYELEEPLHIPAGSKILGIGKYDNSAKNKWNPAPNLPVYWSEQSWDEMYQPFTLYSVDSQNITEMTVTKTPKQ
ncbi:MAG TPA: cytochrome c [Vicinamibacterales bacterium]|nr:cytochrome c [Vicinamibacterales bacterium]